MKILGIVLVLSLSLFGNNYKEFAQKMGYELNYEKAMKIAKKEKKDIMFVMVANFCPWCIKLEKKVLSKKSMDAKVKKGFVPLIMNREEGGFPKAFQTEMIPTVYFVDHLSGKIKTKVVGYNNRQQFIDIVNEQK